MLTVVNVSATIDTGTAKVGDTIDTGTTKGHQ